MGETRGVILLHNLCFIFLPFLLWTLWGLSLGAEMLWLSPGWVPRKEERAREKDSSSWGREGQEVVSWLFQKEVCITRSSGVVLFPGALGEARGCK